MAQARNDLPVRIGVLSFRSLEATTQRWNPLGRYLEQHIPGYHFQIIPYYYPDLDAAVNNSQVDFVLTNPEHFVLLRSSHGLAAFVTFIPLAGGHPVTEFGGVILTRSGRTDINKLEDLSDKTVVAPSRESFGGNMMQLWEFYRHNVQPPKVHYVGMPHDKSIQMLLEDKADAAFVRTGIIEAMVAKGVLRMDQIKLIQQHPPDMFPQIRSTDLYPEWPMAVMKGVPEQLAKDVGVALLQMPPAEAKACDLFGFAPPADYAPVEAIMLRLRMHPGRLQHFDLADVIGKYQKPLLAALAALSVAAFALVAFLFRVNRRLTAFYGEERRLTTELALANRDLRRFSELVAHHLSEPARVMCIQVEWLTRETSTEQRESAAAIIRGEGKRLLALLRGFERYLSLGSLPRTGTCLVDTVLDEVLAFLCRSGGCDAEMVRRDLGELPMSAERLFLVLEALVNNALRYAHPGRSPRVVVAMTRLADEFMLSVSDNGIGIEPQYHERIFEVFERLQGNRQDSAIGLGLAVAKRCVEDIGGRIEVVSILGQGSEFKVFIPAGPDT